MSFAKQDQLAQAFAFHGLHPAFCERVHVGCLDGCAYDIATSVAKDAAELLREQHVVVDHQELHVAQEAINAVREVARDLRHELAVRMRRDARNVNGSRSVMDHEQYVVSDQAALRPHIDGEEVGGCDDVRM